MTIFTAGFSPRYNAEGLSKLLFKSYELMQGKKGEKSEKSGKEYKKDWAMVKFTFECVGKSTGTSKDISVTFSPEIAEEGTLYKFMLALGFKPPVQELVKDEDGFEIAKPNLDEDEFDAGEENTTDNYEFYEKFLSTIMGKKFKAKVEYKSRKGSDYPMWTIDYATVAPLG